MVLAAFDDQLGQEPRQVGVHATDQTMGQVAGIDADTDWTGGHLRELGSTCAHFAGLVMAEGRGHQSAAVLAPARPDDVPEPSRRRL